MSTSCFQFLWPKGFRLQFYLRDPSLVHRGGNDRNWHTNNQPLFFFFIRCSSALSVLLARSLPLEGGNRRKCVYVLKSCMNTMATVCSRSPVGIGLLWHLSLVWCCYRKWCCADRKPQNAQATFGMLLHAAQCILYTAYCVFKKEYLKCFSTFAFTS